MTKILHAIVISIFICDYLSKGINIVPSQVSLLPELLSVCLLIMIPLKINRLLFRPVFLLLFGTLFLHIIVGCLINMVNPGTIIAGLRNYFRTLPVFLTPFLYGINDETIKSQFKIILIFSILQCPLTIYQRLFQYQGTLTGDVITGTLTYSGQLSVYMICLIGVLFSFFLSKRISIFAFSLILFTIFIPTTINETKITIFFLPISLLIPALYSRFTGKSKIKIVLVTFSIIIILSAIFVPIYDHFIKPRWGYGLIDYFTMNNRVKNYLYKGKSQEKIGVTGYDFRDEVISKNKKEVPLPTELARGDSLKNAFNFLSDDPVRFMTGVGIGNASESAMKKYSGSYFLIGTKLGVGLTEISRLIWEIGVIGISLLLLIAYFVFRDLVALSRSGGFWGAFSAGWIGVLAIIILNTMYQSYSQNDTIVYLFVYFTGVLLAKGIENEIQSKTMNSL